MLCNIFDSKKTLSSDNKVLIDCNKMYLCIYNILFFMRNDNSCNTINISEMSLNESFKYNKSKINRLTSNNSDSLSNNNTNETSLESNKKDSLNTPKLLYNKYNIKIDPEILHQLTLIINNHHSQTSLNNIILKLTFSELTNIINKLNNDQINDFFPEFDNDIFKNFKYDKMTTEITKIKNVTILSEIGKTWLKFKRLQTFKFYLNNHLIKTYKNIKITDFIYDHVIENVYFNIFINPQTKLINCQSSNQMALYDFYVISKRLILQYGPTIFKNVKCDLLKCLCKENMCRIDNNSYNVFSSINDLSSFSYHDYLNFIRFSNQNVFDKQDYKKEIFKFKQFMNSENDICTLKKYSEFVENFNIDDKGIESFNIDNEDIESFNIDDEDIENFNIDDEDIENFNIDDEDIKYGDIKCNSTICVTTFQNDTILYDSFIGHKNSSERSSTFFNGNTFNEKLFNIRNFKIFFTFDVIICVSLLLIFAGFIFWKIIYTIRQTIRQRNETF